MNELNNSAVNHTRQKESTLFGDWLIDHQLVTTEQLNDALEYQGQTGGRLGEVFVRLEFLTEEQVTKALGEYLNIDSVSLDDLTEVDSNIARMIPEAIATRFNLVAIRENDERIVVAIADPLNVVAIDTITVKLKRPIRTVIASPTHIKSAIEVIYHGSDVQEQKLRDLVNLEISTEEDEDEFDDPNAVAEAEDAPVIRFVDLLLGHAVNSRASDIHIEPQERGMIIRMRVDGILQEMVPPARKMQTAVIARIKILSEMDIAERRLPQDGRFKMRAASRNIDVRVSVLPTIYGEKIVLRILDKEAVNHNIEKMGFDPKYLDQFKKILKQPHGIIIVTGPTGSGKSTTLYSALNYLKDPTKNITTVEDPVEYRLGGITQTQIRPEIKLTFASCLRSILRQDPDIILLGEIRDKETMEIAMKASLTGHLVLSTFHTNDAPSAISRFIYMGLEPYMLASSLNLIVAQRLVRKICDQCKEPFKLDTDMMRRFRLDDSSIKDRIVYQGKGCQACHNTGYSGRVPIFEFLPMDQAMRDEIARGAGETDIRRIAREKGYNDLTDGGVRRMFEGLTTAEEVMRVTYSEDTD